MKTTQLLPELLDLHSLVITRDRQTDKYLYVIGGEIHNSIYNTVDCYDFNNDRWTSLANLNIPRDGLGVATYGGLIFAAGGMRRVGKFCGNCLVCRLTRSTQICNQFIIINFYVQVVTVRLL